jgi:hypothetical protein
MPLIKCPACEREISTQAQSCPHCGHPLVKSDAKKSQNAGVGCLIMLLIVGTIIYLSNRNETTTTPKETTQEELCRSDWTKCTDNAQLVNNYAGWSQVESDCKEAANNEAQYGNPDWPWIPFGMFYKGKEYVISGIAIAVEPDAQFSNGFGAMVHSRVTCTYDLRGKHVVSVEILPR